MSKKRVVNKLKWARFIHKNHTHRWFTPNTYDTNYAEPPKAPGVYCIKEYDLNNHVFGTPLKSKVVYVGSSINLSQRYRSHEVLTGLIKSNRDKSYAFYFKPVASGFYDLEISLIKRLQPPINKVHK